MKVIAIPALPHPVPDPQADGLQAGGNFPQQDIKRRMAKIPG
jgi:hypothetical protein